jgi:hypothetical protein
MSSRVNHGGSGNRGDVLRVRLPLDLGVLVGVAFCCAVWLGVAYLIQQLVS